MKINFCKYNGAGNDFIVIDNRNKKVKLNKSQILKLCNRNVGIGADGIISLESSDKTDFEILHYTSDGTLGSLCGNGSRCAVSFAHRKKIISRKTRFEAFDGSHEAEIIDDELIIMQMKLNSKIIENDYGIWLDTGSPHLIVETNNFYREEGVNVNFVEKVSDDVFKIRTYERGVEDETQACGTGSTASAICMNYLGRTKSNEIKMRCQGGDLEVRFINNDDEFSEISIKGPARFVFEGVIEV
jgi:diaminopimelate epimerase